MKFSVFTLIAALLLSFSYFSRAQSGCTEVTMNTVLVRQSPANPTPGQLTTFYYNYTLTNSGNNFKSYEIQISSDGFSTYKIIKPCTNPSNFTPGSDANQTTDTFKRAYGTTCSLRVKVTTSAGNCGAGDYCYVTAPIILPVSLVSFAAVTQRTQNCLRFQLASGNDLQQYEIEYSASGTEYKSVYKGSPNQIAQENFEVCHSSFQSPGLYRLRTTDAKGVSAYSYAVRISENVNNLSLSPNPATHSIQITNSTREAFTIYNVVGREMSTGMLQHGTTNIDIAGWPEGMYVLHTSGITKKFWKQ